MSVSLDVEGISDAIESYDALLDRSTHWNGHEITVLSKTDLPVMVSTKLENKPALCKRVIKPLMNRISEGETTIGGGVDNQGNWHVDGRVSFKFGGKSDNDKTNDREKENERVSADPPDSREREYDKNG